MYYTSQAWIVHSCTPSTSPYYSWSYLSCPTMPMNPCWTYSAVESCSPSSLPSPIAISVDWVATPQHVPSSLPNPAWLIGGHPHFIWVILGPVGFQCVPIYPNYGGYHYDLWDASLPFNDFLLLPKAILAEGLHNQFEFLRLRINQISQLKVMNSHCPAH